MAKKGEQPMNISINTIKSELELSVLFWANHMHLTLVAPMGMDQNEYCTDIRVQFTDWMDSMYTQGSLSEDQVNNYTLIAFNDDQFNSIMGIK